MKQLSNHVYGRLAFAILIGMGLVLGFTSLVIAQQTILSEQAYGQEVLDGETAVASTTYRVSKSGNGADGLTWTTAYTDLQDALATATDGDEIWVASGIYTPGTQYSDTFNLVPGVGMYGGFAGNETDRTQRNWETNLSILSGDIDNDDITDFNGIVTSTQFIEGYNTWTILTANSITETNQIFTESTKLDGFTITAGSGWNRTSGWQGGGFYCLGKGVGHSCSPLLKNIHFSGNFAIDGGAMYSRAHEQGVSSPVLVNVIFTGNSASDGGALFSSGYDGGLSTPTLKNVTFTDNVAHGSGGAMANSNASPILNNVTFANNTGQFGAAMSNQSWGEGIIVKPVLNNVTFTDNSTSLWGWGGAINNFSDFNGVISATLNNVTFTHNTAWAGGAVFGRGWQGGNYSATFNNTLFYGNSAGYGGALSNESNGSNSDYYETGKGGTINNIFNNVIFAGNSASNDGGAIRATSYGVNPNHMNLVLNNTTFANNTANSVGAIGIANYSAIAESTVTLNNTILWGNTVTDTGNAIRIISSTLTTTTSLIQGGINGADIYKENATIVDGGGNIADDPLFVRTPDAGDGDWTTPADNDYGDLNLQSGSPAIDAGTNSAINLPTDLAGNPRIFNGTVDMGAYELWRNLPFKTFLPLINR